MDIDRHKDLPPHFTDEERKAYKWLWDCGVRPWVVDLITKRVTTLECEYEGLVEFRKAIEE